MPNTEYRVAPGDTLVVQTASGSSSSGNALMEVAFRITGTFEGGRATSYQNEDNGIVSYGKHQATLASGTLGTILAKYVKRSTSAAAQQLAGFMDRVNRKESSLRNDAGFKKALLDAGADPLMSTLQDEVFAQNYWPAAEQGVKGDTLKSPLALALYYDTNIQGGLASVRKETAKAMKGKAFTEAAYLTEFNRQRDLRLQNLAEGKRTQAGKSSGNTKKQLLKDAEWLDASRSRVTALQSLVAAGDLQLRGDAKGMLHLGTHLVPGLAAGSGGGTQSATPSKVVTPQRKWSLAPSLDDVMKKGALLKEGMQGASVTELQRLLSLESQDGKFGPGTRDAVKAFHETVGIGTSPGLEGTASKATFDALKGGKGKAQGINLAEIARNVHHAMEDGLLETDEQKVYVNLAKLNNDAALIKEFKNLYRSTYHEEVEDALKSDFSNSWFHGNELDRALSYLQPKSPQKKTAGSTQITKSKDTPPPPTGGAKEKSGKDWVSRFLPSNKVSDLKEPFQSSVKKFFAALTAAGVGFDINTTLRPAQRSYLMYYAREIKAGRLEPDKVPAFVPQGGDAPVNIDWAHRDSKGTADLTAAKKAATEMDKAYGAADAIGKPYKSNHNGGEAIDVDFTPAWGIGKSVVDGKGKTVAIRSKQDLINVGATFGVLHWNYSGPKSKKDDPHWSRTGN